jgi:hypothetical protein
LNSRIHDKSSSSPIATKAELLKRLRERTTLRVEAQLKPNGICAQSIRKNSDRENDRRIAILRSALGNAHDTVEAQHSFARLNGFAAARFSKER